MVVPELKKGKGARGGKTGGIYTLKSSWPTPKLLGEGPKLPSKKRKLGRTSRGANHQLYSTTKKVGGAIIECVAYTATQIGA